jgi:hypothetical protein
MDFWLLLDWELEDLFNLGGLGVEEELGLECVTIVNRILLNIYNGYPVT